MKTGHMAKIRSRRSRVGGASHSLQRARERCSPRGCCAAGHGEGGEVLDAGVEQGWLEGRSVTGTLVSCGWFSFFSLSFFSAAGWGRALDGGRGEPAETPRR